MITLQRVEELAAIQHEDLIVSCYIRLDPRLAYNRSQPQLHFKGLISHFLRTNQDPHRRSALEREQQRIESFLETLPREGRGVVIFACQPAQLWETASLDVLLPNHLSVAETTQTSILARMLDDYPMMAVVLVQRNDAKIFTTELRSAHEHQRIESPGVPRQMDRGGWSQRRFERHIEVQVGNHLKEVVDALARMYHREIPFKRLVVGGPVETVNEFVHLLPDQLARRFIGSFPVDFKHESDSEILDRAHEVNEQHERKTEQELVNQLREGHYDGGQGVLGLQESLRGLVERRVHKLVVADFSEHVGAVCTNCGMFDTQPFKNCPACGGPGRKVDNILEHAMEKALVDGVQIEPLGGEPRQWLLSHGGVAALMRY